jgi:hypothetical protein
LNFEDWDLFGIWPAFAEAASGRQVLGIWCFLNATPYALCSMPGKPTHFFL